MRRLPVVAGLFYPADRTAARLAVESCLARARREHPVVETAGAALGLVPHAGWVYSGATAAVTFNAIAAFRPKVSAIVVLGAVHRANVRAPALFGPGAWATPLGDIATDDDLSNAVRQIEVNPAAHAGEHAIEVQLPFVQVAFPKARFVPIAVPPDGRALDVGESVAEAIRGRVGVAVIASSDLTHYGPSYDFTPHGVGSRSHDWAKANDAELLAAASALDASEILRHAATGQSACGPGALAALVVVAKRLGATKGLVLAHTTSHEVACDPAADSRISRDSLEPPSDFVGYASMVFA